MTEPNPGSEEAQEQGCICPVMDNNHGQGIPDGKGGYVFWMNDNCPVHANPDRQR